MVAAENNGWPDSMAEVPQPPIDPPLIRTRDIKKTRKNFRILLIDPRELTRDSISAHLQSRARDVCILTAADPGGPLPSADEECDVALFNTGAGRLDDAAIAEATTALCGRLNDVPVAVLADEDSAQLVVEALRRGVRGYLPSSLGVDVMLAALRLLAAGGIFVPVSALSAPDGAELAGAPLVVDGFTPRQSAVLEALRRGKPNKIIAHELRMCESTVKVHVRNIFKKLGASNRTEAVYLLRNGHPLSEGDPASKER